MATKIQKSDRGFFLMVECEQCQHKFQITAGEAAEHLSHKKQYDVNGQTMYLTYYDCPECGKRHFVQVDDAKSLQMLKECQRTFVKLVAKRHQDKPIPQKQSDKYKKQRRHLSDYRMQLMRQFTGATVHDVETDTDFELRFSV